MCPREAESAPLKASMFVSLKQKGQSPANQSALCGLCHMGHEMEKHNLLRTQLEKMGTLPPPLTPAPGECQVHHMFLGEGYVHSGSFTV